MPALPWTTFSPPDPGRQYVVMASRLPLARYRDTLTFLRATMAIRAQLARSDGLIRYALDAQLARKIDTRFTVTHLSTGPFYFPDLADADADAEQAAIDAGQIRAGCLRYAGRMQ